MRVSATVDYALRALIEIAHREENAPVTAEELSQAQDISRRFLLTILADLQRAGIVRSQRGSAGGWSLARPAHTVTVADVVRAVDGPLVSIHGVRPESVRYNGTASSLQLVWIAARSSLREVLESVTLQHLVDGELPAQVHRRTRDDDAWVPH
ncbi:Rrf2 family transcriptional regulator [Carbonactinospora thermoautotrophica]|uniref:Transcriptional regulator n=1 Tax=Carbonactinospora thermoautotrophica TaxID=1469144 RepID=A0A132NK91_9ACTN|nr:Rrf2 family transcriptional regulator [Carbonactinospora thermoautotrophica]KWX00191.1 hypothetical protein TH66_14980 [Carbonactinospora thermoautotrophica]KWX01803.1 Transcriptional regulator [Carbonactinospora thermoautotrophica]KWX10539.1 hypothetical protein TR74_03000 [Carbonactinospora thermoautotrophica]MCX9190945.1 Rrf2 family transcriptional regulator [Carbonactinospora thermoautotrophica]